MVRNLSVYSEAKILASVYQELTIYIQELIVFSPFINLL